MVQEGGALLTVNRAADAVKQLFAQLGYAEVEPPKGVDLAFKKGNRIIGVNLVKFSRSVVRDRRFIRSEIYRLLREKPCDEVYIAVEGISFGRLPPPYEFRESGIGLVEIGGSSARIAIPAAPLRGENFGLAPERSSPAGAEASSAAQLAEIVRELKALLKELKRGELISETLEVASSRAPVKIEAAERAEGGASETGEDLGRLLAVDFVKDNPWLSILRERKVEG